MTTPSKNNHSAHFETEAVRTQAERSPQREHSVPLYMTSSFVFENAEQARAMFADEIPGSIYTRFSNPNVDEFVRKMALLEGAEDGVAFASGMAAVFAGFAAFLSKGDHVVSSRAVFGSTHQILTRILSRFGVEHTYVDQRDVSQWKAAIRPQTKMLYLETPSNPGLEIADLEALGGLAKERGLILNVDNCFATPYLQKPVEFGAHLVTHSATKFIDGQGRAIGGVVVGDKKLIADLRFFARHTGPSLSPFNAWIFSKSLETLAVRMDRHGANALALAEHLEKSPGVERVIYPFLPSHPDYALARKQMRGGGGIVSFLVAGGLERARRLIDCVEMLSHTANLGDSRTIITHPASTTHSKLTEEERLAVGIYPGLLRVSAGLEHSSDIIAVLDAALSKTA
jgi:O-succinylhomoserine sulfhydrylase